MPGCGPVILSHLDLDGNHGLVVGPANTEDPVDLEVRLALIGHSAVDPVRPENDLGIGGALQDLFMHLSVPHSVSGAAAGGIDDDLAADNSGGGIEMNASPLQIKLAMNGVNGVTQSELHSGFGGNEI